MLDGNGVEVTNFCGWNPISADLVAMPSPHTVTVHQQLVANQGFLECRRHETIARARVGEDGKVDPEEEEVEDQRNNNETKNSGEEMFGDTFLCYALGVWSSVRNQTHTLSDFL